MQLRFYSLNFQEKMLFTFRDICNYFCAEIMNLLLKKDKFH